MSDADAADLQILAEKVTTFLVGLPEAERSVVAGALGLSVADGSDPDVAGFVAGYGRPSKRSNAVANSIYASETAINAQTVGAGGGIPDRQKAVQESIHRFLDIMRSMNPQI